jgi:hypothetical protein
MTLQRRHGRLSRVGGVVGTIAVVLVGAAIFTAVCGRHSAELPESAELPAGGGAADDVRDIRIYCVKGEDGRERLVVENGSTNLIVLPRDSGPIQDELKTGTWLVYFCAQWSVYELQTIATASTAADSLRGTAKVAIREWVKYEDINRLYPGFRERRISSPPLWVLLSDGKVLGDLTGAHRSDEVVAFVRQRLPSR